MKCQSCGRHFSIVGIWWLIALLNLPVVGGAAAVVVLLFGFLAPTSATFFVAVAVLGLSVLIHLLTPVAEITEKGSR